MKSFLSICLNPTFQKTMILSELQENEVNRCLDYRTDPSGKGVNVTRVLTQLGAHATHLTQLGTGREEFLAMTDSDHLTLQWTDSKSPIRTCTTLISKSRGTTTEIVEEGRPVHKQTEQAILELYEKLLPKTECVIISGSKAAGFSNSIFPEMVRSARKKIIMVVLDYRGEDLINSLQWKPTLIKPNYSEFVSTFFPDSQVSEHRDDADLTALVKDKMTELFKKEGIRTILTRGSLPVLFVDDSGKIRDEPVVTVKAVNTIGCGDAFTAGLAFSLNRGDTIQRAVQAGLKCGTLNAAFLRPGIITESLTPVSI